VPGIQRARGDGGAKREPRGGRQREGVAGRIGQESAVVHYFMERSEITESLRRINWRGKGVQSVADLLHSLSFYHKNSQAAIGER